MVAAERSFLTFLKKLHWKLQTGIFAAYEVFSFESSWKTSKIQEVEFIFA